MRLWTVCLLLAATVVLEPLAARAQSLSLTQITEKLEQSQQGLHDLSAKAVFQFALRVGVLPYRDSLEGTYRFEPPDRHHLDFPTAPSYLRQVPSMVSWGLPRPEKYECRVEAQQLDSQEPAYLLHFAPRAATSKIAKILVRVDALQWRISQQDTEYRDGGRVQLRLSYRDDQEFQPLQTVSADLRLPTYHLVGQASIRLSEHRRNPALETTGSSELVP